MTSYYERNKEALLAKHKAWREANPEKVQESQRQWKVANEGYTYTDSTGYVKYIGYQHPAASPSGISSYHRILLWDKLNGKDAPCHWCGKALFWSTDDYHSRLVTDHVNTVKDDNRLENLVPSCNTCNLSREGGQVRRKSAYLNMSCALDFCDRPAYSRFRGMEAVLCRAHYAQAWLGCAFRPVKTHRRSQLVTSTHKQCTICEAVKPHEDFYFRNGKPKGPCKPCERKRIIEAREARKALGIPCEVTGCETPASVKGMCSKHYTQQWNENRKENSGRNLDK